jgi:hypothetical protein
VQKDQPSQRARWRGQLRTQRPEEARYSTSSHQLYDDIIDLDFSIFKGIGSNHTKQFQKNLLQRSFGPSILPNESQTLSRMGVLLSVSDDWKTFTLNNRRPLNAEHTGEYPDSRTRAIKEQESCLDSVDLTRVRDQAFHGRPLKEVQEEGHPRRLKDDGNVHIMTLELSQLPPNIDERFVKKHMFRGQHVVKFDTMRDSISGHCKGKGVIEFRCQGDQQEKFLKSLESKGVKFELKAVRNLRKEGPTTSQVAGNHSAHHINTKDLEVQVKNQWLQEMRKQEERKDRLLKEMEVRA